MIVDRAMAKTFPLWTQDNSRKPFSGHFADGIRFDVCLGVNDRAEPTACLFVHGRIVSGTTEINDQSYADMVDRWITSWFKEHWTGIYNPGLWAAAGYTPEQAQHQLSLPIDHPDRFSPSALNLLAALHNGGER